MPKDQRSIPGRESPAVIALAATMGMTLALMGCASPKGTLFPPITPPRVWPDPPDPPRIRLVGVINESTDLKAARSSSEAFGDALRGRRPPICFSSPQTVSLRGADTVAVTDGNGGAVHLLSLETREHRIVFGSEAESFGSPMGAAWVGPRLFIADAQRHEVVELDENGSWVRSFGRDELVRPVGSAYVAAREQMYVVDGGAHRIVVFDLVGRRVGGFGSRGTATGEFNFPTHIAASGERLLVADSGNFRVQLLDLDGNVVASIGKKGDGAGDLSLPKGVAFDREGRIYVVDAHFETVQIFDPAGRLLLAFGQEGNRPGDFSLPTGLTIDDQDRIWVADSGNRRLQVFKAVGHESK